MIGNRGSGGSGTYLGEGLVITCNHLFRNENGSNNINRIVCTFPDGQSSQAQVVKQDQVWDLAILKLLHPPMNLPGIQWRTDTVPTPGELVVSGGFGGQGSVRWNVGQVRGYGSPRRDIPNKDTMILTGYSRSGDSGGPILDRNGRLVGVLWGSGEGRTVGTQCGRCWRFGKKLFGFLKNGRISRKQPPKLQPIPSPPVSLPPENPPTPDPTIIARLEHIENILGTLTSTLEQQTSIQIELTNKIENIQQQQVVIDYDLIVSRVKEEIGPIPTFFEILELPASGSQN